MKTGEMEKIQNGHRNFPLGITKTEKGIHICTVAPGESCSLVVYRDGKIIFDPSASRNEKAVRNRTLSDGTKQKFGEILIQHEVRVLMTRGVNGLYIYACDPELRAALLRAERERE